MKHLITNISTFIREREQCIAFRIEGQEEPIKAQFKVVKKMVGQISILELEVLLNSFCEPSSYFKRGDTLPNGRKVSADTNWPKTWKITLDGTLEEIRIKNQAHLLNFHSIYDTHIFKKEEKPLSVRVRTTDNNVYFDLLHSFEEIVGIKQEEFHLLRGAFISPVMYKKGDYSDFGGKFTRIEEDNKIVEEFNFRVENTIDNNFNLYSEQVLKNESSYSSTKHYKTHKDADRCHSSYEKYNGYNDFDDETIDIAFEGDPDATWNVD